MIMRFTRHINMNVDRNEQTVMAMAVDGRNYFVSILCLISLVSITEAFHDEKIERNVYDSDFVKIGTRPSIEMLEAVKTETSKATHKAFTQIANGIRSNGAQQYLNKFNGQSHSDFFDFRKHNRETSMSQQDSNTEELPNQPIKPTSGLQTGGLASGDYYFYSLQPKWKNSGFSGLYSRFKGRGVGDYGGARQFRGQGSFLVREMGGPRATAGHRTGLGEEVYLGVKGDAGAVTKSQTNRSKRQSSGFGAQTGFGANAGFGVGGGSSGRTDKTNRRSGGKGQGGFGASSGFGEGGRTIAGR